MEWSVRVPATSTCDFGPLPINGIFSVQLPSARATMRRTRKESDGID
nr:MAG TPA: hypothetical protein [Caudoviricetes sp.]